jgi:hypothetical protein
VRVRARVRCGDLHAVGHLVAEQVPREEAQRDAALSWLPKEVDGVDHLVGRDDEVYDLEVGLEPVADKDHARVDKLTQRAAPRPTNRDTRTSDRAKGSECG